MIYDIIMDQKMDKYGNLTISLFDINDKSDEDKFFYFYMGLDRPNKKLIENAFYQAYSKKLLNKEDPDIIHHEENGVTHIEVHPSNILANIEIIKRILATDVFEDENE